MRVLVLHLLTLETECRVLSLMVYAPVCLYIILPSAPLDLRPGSELWMVRRTTLKKKRENGDGEEKTLLSTCPQHRPNQAAC